jgi:putative flippase GtrA
MEQTKKETLQKGARYLLVGASTALIELGIFSLIFYLFGNNAPVANVIAVIIATTYNFTLSRKFTFKSSSNITRSLILYLCLFVFNMLFTTIATTLLIDFGVMAPLAKIITMACVTLWNFALYNKVVFK